MIEVCSYVPQVNLLATRPMQLLMLVPRVLKTVVRTKVSHLLRHIPPHTTHALQLGAVVAAMRVADSLLPP